MNGKHRKKIRRLVLLFTGLLLMAASAVKPQAAERKPSLSRKKLDMVTGKQDRIFVKNKKGYAVSWKSSKKAVATVSKTGKVKAKRSGAARITAVVKTDQGGKTYRLTCKVFVKKEKRQASAGEKEVSEKNSEQPEYSQGRSSDSPAPTVRPGSASSDLVSGAGDPQIPDPVTSEPLIKDPTTPEPPVPGQPADSTTGSAVADGEAELLFGNYNDGLGDGAFFGNRVLTSFTELQELIREARKEMAGITWRPGHERMQWYIDQLEMIGEDYFADYVLSINTMSVARGYEYKLNMAELVVAGDGSKTLHLGLEAIYNVKDNECVTCDMPYYSYFIRLPQELVQGCESVTCSLVSRRNSVPPEDPEDFYVIPDMVQILCQMHYPI